VRLAAQIISFVFHPLLMTTYLFGLLFAYYPLMFQPQRPNIALLGIIVLMTFILPALNFLFFRLSGSIRDLNMPHRAERLLPFSLVSILYALVTYMFYWKLPIPNVVELLMIITAMVIAGAVATYFYKVSVHCLAVWGLVGILLPLIKASGGEVLLLPATGVILVAGLVMSARLYLNAHTPREVLAGSLMGISIGFAGMIFLF
jgi:membrane-associated phospholipid phosphatase